MFYALIMALGVLSMDPRDNSHLDFISFNNHWYLTAAPGPSNLIVRARRRIGHDFNSILTSNAVTTRHFDTKR